MENIKNVLKNRHGNLLITTVGKRAISTCRMWFSHKKEYDIVLVCYDESNINAFEEISDYVLSRKGFKYPLLYKMFKDYPFLLEMYNYFFFPDDDVEISAESINRLFTFIKTNKLNLCQPSLLPYNYNWAITVNNPLTTFRYVKMIEVMCPAFSKQALKVCLPTFVESQSSWGLEPVWSKLLARVPLTIAVYDEVTVSHINVINLSEGPLYLALKNTGIDAQNELSNLMLKYDTKLDFTELRPIYKKSFHRKMYRLIKQTIRVGNIDSILLMAFQLNLTLAKYLLEISPNEWLNIVDIYKYRNEKATLKFSQMKTVVLIFDNNQKELFKHMIKISKADPNKIPLWLKNWIAMCENEIRELKFSSKDNPDDFFNAVDSHIVQAINIEFKISKNLVVLLNYIVKRMLLAMLTHRKQISKTLQ